MPDGRRLWTLHVWPIGAEGRIPCVLARTPYSAKASLAAWFPWSRLLAESGYHVVVQDVRGRYESEGRFEPFKHEAADGAATLDWLRRQDWFEGRVGLFGWSYLAYCAWAALGASSPSVDALAVAIGSGRLHRVFHPGGSFALSASLEWATGVGARERVPARRIDLARGLDHRPVREADRVALRTLDWYREWVDHPRDDEFWAELKPRPVAQPPPSLLIAGWYDFFLSAQLRDYAGLTAEFAGSLPADSHRLVIGPWAHGLPARASWRRNPLPAVLLRETLAHFERHLKRLAPDTERAPVRFFLPGAERWRDARAWPVPGGEERSLYLRSSARLDPREPGAAGSPWSNPGGDRDGGNGRSPVDLSQRRNEGSAADHHRSQGQNFCGSTPASRWR